MLIVSERHHLAYREVPKCASTTMFRFFLDLNGVAAQARPRRYFAENSQSLYQQLGLRTVNLTGASLVKFVAKLSGYSFFSVVRNPYSRLVSTYRNKLGKFARRFHRRGYCQGKLMQLLHGPPAWGNSNRASDCMSRFVSFEQFVHGLQVHGLRFDEHYLPQRDLLTPDLIAYQRLIPLENLQAGLDDLFAAHRDDASLGPVRRPQQLNQSGSHASRQSCLTPETRDQVYQLYRRDFDFLGYAK